MNCTQCKESAVWDQPLLCKTHFCASVEERVQKTIEKEQLFLFEDKVCVAVSGGKDSLSLLLILKKQGYRVEALAVDEGIAGYRSGYLDLVKEFCSEQGISLVVKSFSEETGKELDVWLKEGGRACTICAAFRKNILNKYSKEFSVLATGHNLDDEAQAVLMNLFRANRSLFFSLGPKSGVRKGFRQRVKPLYYLTEKELLTYAFLQGLVREFTECPYAVDSFRGKVRDALNRYEEEHPDVKMNIVEHYLGLKDRMSGVCVGSEQAFCSDCGEPCRQERCQSCILISGVAV